MRKIKVFALIASLVMLATACDKDDNDNSARSGSGFINPYKEIATFADLDSLLGRTDIDAMRTDFAYAGYDVDFRANGLTAIKRNDTYSTAYSFEVNQGKITKAKFTYGERDLNASGRLKSSVLEKINDEMVFSSGKEQQSYHGHVHNGDSDQHSFSSVDEFVTWFTDAVLNDHVEGESTRTFDTYKTSVDIYPDDWGISIEVR